MAVKIKSALKIKWGIKMCEYSRKDLDVFKRLLLEAENLLERVEEDEHSNIAWICERETLAEAVQEAREIFWPKGEDDGLVRQED